MGEEEFFGNGESVDTYYGNEPGTDFSIWSGPVNPPSNQVIASGGESWSDLMKVGVGTALQIGAGVNGVPLQSPNERYVRDPRTGAYYRSGTTTPVGFAPRSGQVYGQGQGGMFGGIPPMALVGIAAVAVLMLMRR